MTRAEAREQARQLVREMPTLDQDHSRHTDAIARALLLAQAEAMEKAAIDLSFDAAALRREAEES
jgi:hypothetical protein